MAQKKQTKKEEQLSQEDLEKMELIAKADEVKGEQLVIGLEGDLQTEDELKKFALGNLEDPERHYDVYYGGLQKLLKKFLPEGPAYETARGYIYEEKNTFLTRGHRIDKDGKRGADSRMGHLSDAEELLKIVIKWKVNNGTMVELFNIFRELNISKGYGKPQHG